LAADEEFTAAENRPKKMRLATIRPQKNNSTASDVMHNMQQNNHSLTKLLREFQFHTQPEIRRKQVSHKSATKISSRPNISSEKFHWPAEWP